MTAIKTARQTKKGLHWEPGDYALTRDDKVAIIHRLTREDGVEFAWFRYHDPSEQPAGNGYVMAGGFDGGGHVWEHGLRDRLVCPSNDVYYDSSKWVEEQGLRALPEDHPLLLAGAETTADKIRVGQFFKVGRLTAEVIEVERVSKVGVSVTYRTVTRKGRRAQRASWTSFQPSDRIKLVGNPADLNQNRPASRTEGEAKMAKVTRKSATTKQSTAKPAAKASTGTKRTTEDIDKLVPAIVKSLQGGAKMQEVKEEFGFSHGQPIRQALARNGYDSKGNSLSVEAITGTGAALAKKVAAERAKGVAWYLLAKRTGKSEPELRTLLEENGHDTEGRAYAPAAPKPAAAKKAPAKAGTKVARRKATKAADPSPQA